MKITTICDFSFSKTLKCYQQYSFCKSFSVRNYQFILTQIVPTCIPISMWYILPKRYNLKQMVSNNKLKYVILTSIVGTEKKVYCEKSRNQQNMVSLIWTDVWQKILSLLWQHHLLVFKQNTHTPSAPLICSVYCSCLQFFFFFFGAQYKPIHSDES